MLVIAQVTTEADAADVRRLVGAYVEWLGDRYPDDRAAVAAYFVAQGLETQLRDLLTLFCPPKAGCLLARLDGVAVGVVMVKPNSEGVCEMNRMFVHPSARGNGVGVALVTELLETARGLGYRRMLLTAGAKHTEALGLYRRFGFIRDDTLPDTGAGDIEVRMIRDL